jgi:Na+-driven multidrug efflux pump
VQAVEYTIALGGGTWISRLLGEEKKEQGYGVATATLWFSLVVGAIIALLGWWQSDFIVGFLGAEGELLPISVAYFLPMVLSSPLLGGTLALTCIWRAQGKAVFSMMGMAVGFGVNILADYLFLSFGSFGVAAIGWGTFMGYGVSFLVLLLPFIGKEKGMFGGIKKLPKSFSVYGTIIKNGISSFFRQGLISITTLLLNRKASLFGTDVLAGITAAGKVSALLYSAFLGIGQGYQPLAGYCYGAKNRKRLKKAFGIALVFGTMFLSLLAGLCYLFSPVIIGWLDAGRSEVFSVGVKALQTQMWGMPLVPFGVLVNMTVQAADRPVQAVVLACLRQGLCFLPFILFFPLWFGIQGLYLAQPLADTLTFLIALVFCVRFWRTV